jgi:Protein of unknown function (DUF1552)
MIITKKAIPRRTVLRGLGATLALPLLDAMVPALTAQSKTLAASPVRRLGVVYVGNGASPGYWTPPASPGPGFELSPILKPIAPFKDRIVVVTGLDNAPGLQGIGEPGGAHGRCAGAFLTAAHPKPTEGADFRAGKSLDQVAAATLGKQTQLPSLEMQLEIVDFAGACDGGYSCAYENTLCWSTPTTPLPMENNPRVIFERMFGESGSTDPAVRMARMQDDASVLDSVMERTKHLQKALGSFDRAKLDQYLEAIRAAESRIQKAEAQGARELPAVAQPTGIPVSWHDHAKLMFDLQVLAYQSDMTRIITFMLVRDHSTRVHLEAGVSEAHHPISHHQENPENKAKLAKINAYHVGLFTYYLEKLQATPEGDGTLLDHVLLMYASAMGDPNYHDPRGLPVLLAGGASGQLKGGRHLQLPKGTPLANLYLTALQMVGVPEERFGDSTGVLSELAV